MAGNYFGSMKLGKQLADKAREVAQEKEEAESRLNDLEKRIALAKTLGLPVDSFEVSLKKAREFYERREYKDCISTAIQTAEALKVDVDKMFSSRMDSTSSMMHFLSERGSDVSPLQSALDSVRKLLNEGKYEEAESSLTTIWHKEEKTLAEMFSHEFSAVQKAMIAARTYCGEVEGVDRALTEARNEITANNVGSAFKLLEQANGLITRQIRTKVDEEVKRLSQKIELSKLFGLGIGPYREKLEQIRSSPSAQKFTEMQHVIDSLDSELDRRLKRAFEIRLKTVRSDLGDRTLPPSITSIASTSLKDVELKVESSDFEAGLTELKDLESRLEKAKYDYIARILFNGKKYITLALRNGLDLAPVNKHLNDVRELMKKRRYREAVEAAELANQEAMRLSTLTTDAEDVMKKLDSEFQAVVTLVSNSVDMSIRYAEAKRKYENKEFESFTADARSLLKDMDVLLENFATGQIDALDRGIGALEYLGGETLDLNKKLGSAVSLVKNTEFAKSLTVSADIERDVENRLKELEQTWSLKAKTSVDSSKGLMKERLGKMLYAVTQFEAKGESYRSASVAKDIVDWAFNGNVYRVRSLIQRARRLLTVVPEVNSSSAVNMLEAAERNAEMDTETALNTAGEAHDILYNLLNDYFVKEMSSLMDMVSTCRRKRVEIGYGYTLIGRARAALKFEDFEAASRMVSVAREEIQKRLRQVEDIEADLSKADRLLVEARKSSMGVEDIQKLLLEAKASLKRYDYVQAKREISQALLLEEKGMAPNLAGKEILEVKAVLAVGREMGLAQDQLEQQKDDLLELMKERKHYEALTGARSLLKETSSAVASSLNEMLIGIAAESAKAEIDGLDVTIVESRLERAKGFLASGHFEQCFNSLKLARDELGLVKNSVNEAISLIEKADAFVIKLDELNLLDSGTANLLRQSKNLLKNDQHLLAMQTAQKCIEACSDRLSSKGSQLLEKYTHQIYSSIGNDEHEGVSARVNEATSLVAKGNDEAADALILLKNMAERLALQEEMARRTLEVLNKRSSALLEKGIASGELNTRIRSISELLDSKSFRSVVEKGIEVEQLIEEIAKEGEKARQKMSTLEDKLARFEEMGLPMEGCTAMARDALELVSTGSTLEGMAKIRACDEAADSLLHEACISKVAAVESAEEAAGRLSLSTGEERKTEFDGMIASGDTAGAYLLAERRYNEIAPLVTSTLRSRFEGIVGGDGLSKNFSEGLRREFEETIAAQRFSECLDFISKAEADIASKSALMLEMNNLSRQFSDVSGELRKTGINVRSFDLRFRSLSQDVSEKGIEDLKKLMDDMKRMKAEFSPRLLIDGDRSKWGPQVTVRNEGRVVALSTSLSIKGGAINKAENLGNLKPGESRTMNLPATLHGEVVALAAASSPIDGSSISSSKNFALEGNSIMQVLQCRFCRGRIKEKAKVHECACGLTYHEQCAARQGTCECGRELHL